MSLMQSRVTTMRKELILTRFYYPHGSLSGFLTLTALTLMILFLISQRRDREKEDDKRISSTYYIYTPR